MVTCVWIFVGGVALLMIGTMMASGCPRYADDRKSIDKAIYKAGERITAIGGASMVLALLGMAICL